MTYLVGGGNLTEAWLNAVRYLRSAGREAFNLVVDVSDARPIAADATTVSVLDALLVDKDLQDVRTVANTIFPSELARTSANPERLYQRYQSILPRLRRQAKNRKGTYFERLIAYPAHDGQSVLTNQLELILEDLGTEVVHRRAGKPAMRHIYEAQIFAPGKDRRPLGFPCMSSLSFHLDGDHLRLTGTYRNQYYLERALGNFLGLAELQRFVAESAGLQQGPLVIHAFHAELDRTIGLGEIDTLIRHCQASSGLVAATVSQT